jgi:hypothetical protein
MGGSKTVVQAPPPAPAPDYSKISKDTLQAQIDLAPKLFAAEASPVYGQAAYANLQNQVNNILLSGQMGQLAQYYPQLANIETDYQTRLRQGELGQITSPELGLGAYQQAFNQLTPGYAEAVSGMGELARTATEQSVQRPTYTAYEQEVEGPSYGQYIGQIQGPSADLTLGGMQAYNFGGTQETPYQVGQNFLQAQPYQVGKDFLNQPAYQAGLYTGQVAGPQMQSKLGQIDTGLVNAYMNQLPGVAEGAQRLGEQVNLDLAAGRSLTPEQARLATQAAREAYAARGMALGPQAIGAEILGREELANQRYRERQAAAQQAMGTISDLYTPALQQAYQRQAGAEAYNLGAQGQAFGQALSQEDMSRAAQAQQFSQLGAREQALAQAQAQQFGQLGAKEQALSGAQAQRFGQAMTEEEATRQAQAQEFGQRVGLQELGLNLQGQQYQQAMGQEALAQQTQNQALQQALQRTQQGIAGQQAMLGLQGQQAQIGAAAMGALQGAQAPILQAFYRQPILSGSMGQAQQFALGGQQMAGPGLYNPESQMAFQSAFMPYQANIAERTAAMQANAAASAGRSGMMGGIIGGIAGGLGAAF